MSAIASQITGVSIACSTIYSSATQRKHQSSASLAFVGGIHRRPEDSPHKGPVTRKLFPFDEVIMVTVDISCVPEDFIALRFTILLHSTPYHLHSQRDISSSQNWSLVLWCKWQSSGGPSTGVLQTTCHPCTRPEGHVIRMATKFIICAA